MTDVQIAIEVLEFIHASEGVSKEQFRRWLRTRDPDVLGALYHAAAHGWSRVQGGVSRREFRELLDHLVAATLARPGKSPYGLSDYAAVRTYCGFLTECYRDAARDSEALACLRAGVRTLARLYRAGSVGQRRCLVDGCIEHLFEQKGVEVYFRGWKKDRVLAKAYREAAEWAADQPPPAVQPKTSA